MDKAGIIKEVADTISDGNMDQAREIIGTYPFIKPKTFKRNYSVKQRMEVYRRDGFIDRYSGERLVNPGMLKVLSDMFPEEFPYQLHWKMSETHIAYYELMPTIDHIVPIAIGGQDNYDNYVTTSMMHNQMKGMWTIEQLNWTVKPKGDLSEWDGLTKEFVEIVKGNKDLMKDIYVWNWYNTSL